MASGQSEVSICNLALSRLGEESITALSDNTPQAIECNRLYAITRDMELRGHNWNFAIRRADLAADTTSPSWGYDNRYRLPADFLKLVEVESTDQWRVEAGNAGESGSFFVLTDLSDPIYIRYVARVTDPAVFDPLFINMLAARLAMDLAPKLTQLLPSGIGPEGAVTIPARNLFVTANETDLGEDGGPRSHVMLYAFEAGKAPHDCALCGASDTYLDEVITDDAGSRMFVCSDTDYCAERRGEAA